MPAREIITGTIVLGAMLISYLVVSAQNDSGSLIGKTESISEQPAEEFQTESAPQQVAPNQPINTRAARAGDNRIDASRTVPISFPAESSPQSIPVAPCESHR